MTDQQQSADDVVQATGWVFNNETGDAADARRVRRDRRRRGAGVPRRLRPATRRRRERSALVEIGSGIGRMTCAFTRAFGDACTPATSTPGSSSAAARRSPGSARSTGCARSRSPTAARSTSPTTSPTSTFSYITLQHCARERRPRARRRGGAGRPRRAGTIALNFRPRVVGRRASCCRSAASSAACSASPALGPWLSQHRAVDPARPGRPTGSTRTRCSIRSRDRVTDVAIWRNPRGRRRSGAPGRRAALLRRRSTRTTGGSSPRVAETGEPERAELHARR